MSITSFSKFDVIYNNAALHWSLHHNLLFPSVVRNLLNPADTRTQPSHLLMETASLSADKVKSHIRYAVLASSKTHQSSSCLSPVLAKRSTCGPRITCNKCPIMTTTGHTQCHRLIQAREGRHFLAVCESLLRGAYPPTTAPFPDKGKGTEEEKGKEKQYK